GDRLQFRKAVDVPASRGARIRNGALASVECIAEDGTARLRLDSKRHVTLNLREQPFVDYGYAITSYKSQGATTERAILAANTEDSKLLLNQAQIYVSLSRAK